jgi:hypothetical protein
MAEFDLEASCLFDFGVLYVDDRLDSAGVGVRVDREQDRQHDNLFGGSGLTGFNIESVYSAGGAAIGAVVVLALYYVFFRRRML